jgi:hypothetical protein
MVSPSRMGDDLTLMLAYAALVFLPLFPPERFRVDRGFFFSKAFFTDAAWRGSAAAFRISSTIEPECWRECDGMSPPR